MSNNQKKTIQTWEGKHLKVVVPFSRAGVAQHIWITNEKGSIIVDTGDGLLRDILSHQFDLDLLKAIIYTHGHFDHVGGLYSLLGFLRMIGRSDDVSVFLPAGCLEVMNTVKSFLQSYADTIPYTITHKEVKKHEQFLVSGIQIKAFPVIHCGSIKGKGVLDPIPAYGYRVVYRNEIVAITGDTGTAADIAGLVKGADLAVIESVYERKTDASKESLDSVHLSEDIACEYGKLAKEFIIIHKGKRN